MGTLETVLQCIIVTLENSVYILLLVYDRYFRKCIILNLLRTCSVKRIEHTLESLLNIL